MKFRRLTVFALSVLICMTVLFGLMPAETRAYGLLNPDESCGVTLAYHPDHGGMDGIQFSLYRIGDVSAGAQLSFTDDWKDYPVSMKDLDAAGWARLANTLAGYVEQDGGEKLKPAKTARTDTSGNASFTGVATGVYLLLGDSYEVKETLTDGSIVTYHYEPRPEMIILPYLSEDEWVYERAVGAVKYEVEDTTETPTIDRRVIKIWDDAGQSGNRPESIEIALLKNGAVYEVVTLDRLNAWRHDWTGLDANATWRVVELTRPLNYTVSIDRNGSTFTVTNTYHKPDDPYVPPDEPDEPDPPDVPEPYVRPDDPSLLVNAPDVPEDIPDPSIPLIPWVSIPDEPEEPEDLPDPDVPLTPPDETEDLPDPDVPLEDLPQTGQLWWPVPVLACVALALFGIGTVLIRKKD